MPFFEKQITKDVKIVFFWYFFQKFSMKCFVLEKLLAILNTKICQHYWGIVKSFDKNNVYSSMLIMSFKLHKTGNFNVESMKNYNFLIKWGTIYVLRTIYIWLEGIFKYNLTKTKYKIGIFYGINFEEEQIWELTFLREKILS